MLVACSSTAAERPSGATSDSSTTTGPLQQPETCGADEARRAVNTLLEALNNGDAATADAAVAPEPRFLWFSVDPERLNSAASDRTTLLGFFQDMISAEIQTEVASFTFNSYRAQDRTGNFGFHLRQRSADGPATEVAGKGAIDCETGHVMLWTVGPRLG